MEAINARYEAMRDPIRRPMPLEPASFWFRCSYVHGLASSADGGLHSNVLRIRLQFNWFDRCIRHIVSKLPLMLQSWVSAIFPKWTLPPTVILKTSKPDAYPESFDNEVSIYKRLKSIQGNVVPVCYGEAKYQGHRALILSDIGGNSLYSPQIPVLTKEDFTEKMSKAIGALHQLGVEHDDNFLPNYHLVNDRIFILDHEMSQLVEEEDKKLYMEDDISQLWSHLQTQQNTQRFDGLRG